nr:MAG TPA: hypothetical protein [Caudoviricetes sp.]
MIIQKLLALADEVKPNALSTDLKIQYINECEGLIQTEVMLLPAGEIVTYDADDLEKSTLVRPPHDKLYLVYLEAMIDYTNGEYNRYANTIALFDSYMREYHRWYFDKVHPADLDESARKNAMQALYGGTT